MSHPPVTDLDYESGVVEVKTQNAIIEKLEEDESSCRFSPVEFLQIFF
jgi:hypothetical protein